MVSAIVVGLAFAPRTCSVSTARASQTMLDCMLSSDADCLYTFLSSEERSKGGVDRATFGAFVARVWKPAISGFRRHATAGQQEYAYGNLDVAELRHQDGRRLTVASLASRADDKAIHPALVLDMTLTSLLASRRAGLPNPVGAEKERYFAQALRQRLSTLESSGLSGATVSVPGTGRSKFYTWSELADRFDRRAALFVRLPTLPAEERAAAVRAYKEWEAAGL